jgi:ubiquinone/menaquinone biosynthesis C-methylase UbiE
MTCASVRTAIDFDDADAYERFMGRWSRAAGARFLEWLDPPQRARWLDVGCGTGAFTRLINEGCVPAAIVALDPSPAQIAYASRLPSMAAAEFHVAAAEAIACADGSCDVVVSALALNFIADRTASIREMRRVARNGGLIGAYVWDFVEERTPHAPIVRALRRLGINAPAPPGGEECCTSALHSLFASGDLVQVETTTIDIEVRFADFTEFWTAQTPSFSPTTRLLESLDDNFCARVMDTVRAELPHSPDGSIVSQARANAVKARVPRIGPALP